jgi:DNA-binding transcriptional MerR regulator
MDSMLKFGEFSRLIQVTVKTLHHYDDLGLLQPAHIGQFTGYRYYTVEQLPRIHRIMALN